MLRSIRSFSSSSLRASFAKMQLLGTVGNVSYRETRDGIKFINYSLAVNKYAPNEETGTTTDWYNISVFNERHVASFEKFLKPGVQLFVECDARQRVVVDENTDSKHTLTSLKQTSFDVVRFAKKDENAEETVDA
ncbi:uncharacterized protein PRCAT00005140001 [Priceomyces carsonii]|uniref:uncharacterized protein n=1 Tax=Priceomyces carsonii TaxID=28549 RepID=UPI002ED7E02F|nr:unnamed protein product [Priceomyces carsonii]